MSASDLPRLDRRTAIKWMLTAAAAIAITDRPFYAAPANAPSGKGYGTDPDLTKNYRPGELWPLTMTEKQRHAATALCAILIPAENGVPSAAELRVQDFIDEWISAPYPENRKDRRLILGGLAWTDAESQRRFGRDFADLEPTQAEAICDDICHAPAARPELKDAAKFFARYRDLTSGGFFTTPEGMKDLGYVGNTPLAEFKGPPAEVLTKLGLD